ncbi:putative porin [Flavisericum labens]|uniref:putative porin n=1 Tax=Flavisericum labens TaxID=3377112 RepID=UPI00387B4AB0
MKKVILFIFLLFVTMGVQAQDKKVKNGGEQRRASLSRQDSLTRSPKQKDTIKAVRALKRITGLDQEANNKAKIEDYLIISSENDTTYVDTTLTIQKDYKFNYLRKDNFGLIPFANLGQTYNSLTLDFQNTNLMPLFGARARHFNYMEVEDIYYYRVPTPLTELFFRTAFEQGQLVDSFFTVNTSPQFNFSIAYKGLRSLGKYQNILTSTGNFRFTSNYQTSDKRYKVQGHIVTQDLLNQENGGLSDNSIEPFETGEPEFLDRSILDVNFENAESILRGKRFYLNHSYNIFNHVEQEVQEEVKLDSLNDSIKVRKPMGKFLEKNKLDLRHIISFEDKFFEYNQATAATGIFGEAFNTRNLKERVTLENFYNKLQLEYYNHLLGNFQFNISNNNYNYGYNRLVLLNGQTITNRLKGNVYSAGGKYQKQYKGFNLQGEMGVNVSGDFEGNFIKALASFKLREGVSAQASLNHSSRAPNYNTLLYQSNYINYNWQNNFNNTETQQLAFQLKLKNYAKVTVDFSTINDYVYFKKEADTLEVKPYQNNNTINYLRLKFENELKFGKFALANTIMYQNVKDDNNILNMPEFNTRNTLYFSSHVFRKALYLQTGVTLNYFTKYYMDAYSPLLAEFYTQTDRKYGSFPRFDYFLNAKIRQTRIYFKAEHFNSAYTGYNYYSAPNYPYRDFIIRFGVVWNFFL